ncbi:hypothetical protein D3C87_566750 [compost metagenome]
MSVSFSEVVKSQHISTLIRTYFIEKSGYPIEYLNAVGEELINRGYDLKKYDEQEYIKLISPVFHKGWQNELYNMFKELLERGWAKEHTLIYGESWGTFVFEGILSENEQFLEVVEKYKKIFEASCGECGYKGEIEGQYEPPLCQKCIVKVIEEKTIKNISDIGFEYYDSPLYTDQIGKNVYVYWNDIKQIEIMEVYGELHSEIKLNLKKYTKKEEEKIEVTMSFLGEYEIDFSSEYAYNFFELIKHIPKNKLTKAQLIKIEKILSFKRCSICDKHAVLHDICLVCSNELPSITIQDSYWLKSYGTIENIISKKKKEFNENKNDRAELRYKFEKDKSFV